MNSQEQMGIYKEMEQKGWLNNSDTYRAKDSGVYGRMYQLINHTKSFCQYHFRNRKIFILCFIKCHVRPGVVQAK